MTKRPIRRLAWGHQSRHCVYCGKVGPRVVAVGGYAHRRCIPKGMARSGGRHEFRAEH